MKPKPSRVYFWGWGSWPPQLDPLMTDERMTTLMRAWRRSRTQGGRDFLTKRIGAHHWGITHVATGEVAVAIWGR